MPEFDACLRQVMQLHGALGAQVVDHVSGATVAFTGGGPGDAHPGGADGPAQVARTTLSSAVFAPLASPGHIEDIIITAANGHHVMHFVTPAFDARLVLYVQLDRERGNLAITQRALRAIGRELTAP